MCKLYICMCMCSGWPQSKLYIEFQDESDSTQSETPSSTPGNTPGTTPNSAKRKRGDDGDSDSEPEDDVRYKIIFVYCFVVQELL